MEGNYPKTIRIPIEARYAMKDGEMQMVSAVYADVSVDEIAKRILAAFGVPIKKEVSRCNGNRWA